MTINQQVIIITGAANGICRQVAKDLDKKYNILCLFDKDPKLKNQKKDFSKAIVFTKCGDVSSEKTVKTFVQDVVKKFSKIDVLVNGAAAVPYNPLTETNWDLFMNTIKTNLGGYFLFSREVARVMKNQEKGSIINIGSISSYIGIHGQTAYSSSKGGISALTRVLATELGPFGIKVNTLAPGSIVVKRNRKAMLSKWSEEELKSNIPLGRFGTPKDISGAVQFLISELSDYVHGAIITIDGGMTTRGS